MNKTQIGLNIKLYRKRAGLTQKQLAFKIGKTESSVRKYELGLVQVPTDVLDTIASALKTSPFALLGADKSDLEFESAGLSKEVKALETASEAFGETAMSILISFSLLNAEGRKKAAEYISDLAEHPKYHK